MNTFKKTLLATAAVSTMAIAAPAAVAEIAASATISSSYLWRGSDLGAGNFSGLVSGGEEYNSSKGVPALSADLVYSEGGFYGGLWLSSGDAAAGTEYDYFAGYGGSVGSISYDIGLATYVYPTSGGEPGDLSELIISLGTGPVSVTLYDNIAGDSGYTYTTIGYEAGDFAFTYGEHKDAMSHFDISYAVNDSISFTMSSVVDDNGGASDDDTTFVASYSLPF
ncbi:MAG: TorF family putative porin [Porticoccaceae bacterium]